MVRRSFTLIEVIVAISLLAVIAGVLVWGVGRSVGAMRTQSSKNRLENLFLQAFRFSSISGHACDVIICQYREGWRGSLSLWENSASNIHLLNRSGTSIGQLGGVQRILLNDCEVQSATFRFFGGHGLTLIYAQDQFGREIPPAAFRFVRDSNSPVEPELVLSMYPSNNPTPVETISLKPYCMTVPRHPQFPNDYTQAT